MPTHTSMPTSANPKPLAGKVAVVTGAGRGIGRAIALAFGDAGASVCCVARTQSEIDAVAQAIRHGEALDVQNVHGTQNAHGTQSAQSVLDNRSAPNASDSQNVESQSTDYKGNAIAVAADVTQTTEIDKIMEETVAAFGGIDILVLNAATQLDRNTIEESDSDNWWKTIEVNLYGPYCCAKAAIPYLKKSGQGKIITMGSGMGHRASASSSAYSVSKAGLWMFTRILAQELAEFNISVNELIPGPVDTSMTTNSKAQGSIAFTAGSEWIKQPEDVVPLALWLATQPPIGPTAQSYSLMRRDK